MKKNNSIEVKGLSKKYRINNVFSYGSLREELVNLFIPSSVKKNDNESIWAIKDLSFNIEKGSSVGLIGSNGAGKSTLLKVLSRITFPTEGYARMDGRITSLLEAGTGFHPELTGKENIFLNGAVLGMRKHEIQKQFDSIASFAGVENFLDTPVKHYSSGMYTKLAFSVAAHLDQDILMIDEVLSVGDLSFQNKAMEKISEMENSGKTIIFVSHNMTAVSRVCNKVIWMDKGKIVGFDDTNKIIKKYMKYSSMKSDKKVAFSRDSYFNNTGIDKFEIKYIEIKPLNSKKKDISFKEPFLIKIVGRAIQNLDNFSIGFGVKSLMEGPVFNSYSTDAHLGTSYNKGELEFNISIDPNILLPGSYSIDIAAHGPGISQWIPNALQFQIYESSLNKLRINSAGVIAYPAVWSLIK